MKELCPEEERTAAARRRSGTPAAPVHDLDAVLLRPLLSSATFTGDRTVTLLYSVGGDQRYRVQERSQVRSYDRQGRLVAQRTVAKGAVVRVPAGGLVLLTGR